MYRHVGRDFKMNGAPNVNRRLTLKKSIAFTTR